MNLFSLDLSFSPSNPSVPPAPQELEGGLITADVTSALGDILHLQHQGVGPRGYASLGEKPGLETPSSSNTLGVE